MHKACRMLSDEMLSGSGSHRKAFHHSFLSAGHRGSETSDMACIDCTSLAAPSQHLHSRVVGIYSDLWSIPCETQWKLWKVALSQIYHRFSLCLIDLNQFLNLMLSLSVASPMLRRFAPAETSSPSQALHSERTQGTGSSQLCWLQGCLEQRNPETSETTLRSTFFTVNSFKEEIAIMSKQNAFFIFLPCMRHCEVTFPNSLEYNPGNSWRLSDHQALVIDLSLGTPRSGAAGGQNSGTDGFLFAVRMTGAQGLPPNMASCITRRIRAWRLAKKKEERIFQKLT